MDVALLARDVQIAAENEPRRGLALRRELLQPFEKAQLGSEILVAVRHVDGSDLEVAGPRRDDAGLVVEVGMGKERPAGKSLLAQLQGHAGVALVPVPERPVAGERAERRG